MSRIWQGAYWWVVTEILDNLCNKPSLQNVIWFIGQNQVFNFAPKNLEMKAWVEINEQAHELRRFSVERCDKRLAVLATWLVIYCFCWNIKFKERNERWIFLPKPVLCWVYEVPLFYEKQITIWFLLGARIFTIRYAIYKWWNDVKCMCSAWKKYHFFPLADDDNE